jgi:drug/metabolite transporter (DMT)-like permease
MSSAAGAAAVLAAVVLWGVQLPVATLAFARVDPYHVTGIRYWIAAVVLVPLLIYREGTGALRYRNRAWGVSALGIIGTCISPMLTYVGLSYSQPEHAVVISALQPLMVALAERVFRRRRLSLFTLSCIILALVGVMMVVTDGKTVHLLSVRQLAGDALIFGGAIAWVAFAITSENFSDWSTLSFTTLTIIPGAISTLLVVALAVAGGVVPPLASSDLLAAWPELLYLSVGSALIAMLCWNAGNRRIGALNAMLLINLQPVVTFAVRYLQGYRFTYLEIIGAVIVVGALLANTLHLRTAR